MTRLAVERNMIDRAVELHRSLCPGLALGVRAGSVAVRDLGEGPDNLVAMVESDMCGIDGVQSVTGCTLGNRNLIFQDWGKSVFTFWRRSDGRAIRLAGRPSWSAEYQEARRRVASGEAGPEEVDLLEQRTEEEAQRVLEADAEDLFEITEIVSPVPATSKVDPWVLCHRCHEQVMETRSRRLVGSTLCIPCFELARTAN